MAETCPRCGGSDLDRVEVDIGVGTQYGPWCCFTCGWGEDEMMDPTIIAGDLADEKTYTLDDLIARLDTESVAAKNQETLVDLYKAEIKKRLEAAGFVKGQAYTLGTGVGVLYTSRKTDKYIDRETLVLEGVDVAIIDKATKGGEDGKPFVQIQRPRKKGEHHADALTPPAPAPEA